MQVLVKYVKLFYSLIAQLIVYYSPIIVSNVFVVDSYDL